MKQKAFTLMELMIVIVIIGILSAVGMVMFGGQAEKAKIAVAKSNYKQFKTLIYTEVMQCNNGLTDKFLYFSPGNYQHVGCPISGSYHAYVGTKHYFRFGPGSDMKNPYNPDEIAWRISTSYKNDADVGYISVSTYLEELRIRSCFAIPCSDPNNHVAIAVDVVN